MTYVLGLTGGIATGKSTVGQMFAQAGIPVIDADQIARQIVEPGMPALNEAVAHFGPQILQADGHLNRQVLGQIVFHDPQALAALNAINRPYLRQAITHALTEATATGAPLVVGEIQLLFEANYTEVFDGVAVVVTDAATQLTRLMHRNQLDETEAKARIAAQMALTDKVKLADFVIDNGDGLEATRAQVLALIAQLTVL
ncbi:dephospho-CoA kinase [Lacticaseibacillus brantae]|uniref:Dephospho-CoA kinase n=1 Tax=Lacticaseibacillus brantae DSM 23927 TaxID=1423727 RepID=A0A0R2B9P5_9LACO|nr:dephospho-CoA kinase [Lacticaseibacillus brantae]KRM72886.1 dephospho-CoA kinase [Lacticaseibacillus brantae DSM 23927]